MLSILLAMSENCEERMSMDDGRRMEQRLSTELFAKTKAELQRSANLRKWVHGSAHCLIGLPLIKGTSVTFPWRCFVCWDCGQVFLAEPLEHCPFLEMLDLCYYFIIINNYKSTEMSVCGSIGKRVKLAHCVIRWMETSSTPLDKLYKVHDARFAKCAQL